MCINTIPGRKDISNNLCEAIIPAHQSEKGYKAKQFEVHGSAPVSCLNKAAPAVCETHTC